MENKQHSRKIASNARRVRVSRHENAGPVSAEKICTVIGAMSRIEVILSREGLTYPDEAVSSLQSDVYIHMDHLGIVHVGLEDTLGIRLKTTLAGIISATIKNCDAGDLLALKNNLDSAVKKIDAAMNK